MRLGLLLSLVSLAVIIFLMQRSREPVQISAHHHSGAVATVEPSPLCPWREPQADLLAFFAPATNYVLETRIVTGLMTRIQKQLGRPLNPDENPLRIYRVMHEGHPVGEVLVTRLKAEHGGVELITGIDTNGTVKGLRLQSQREPQEIAQALASEKFLESFAGKTASSPLRVGKDLPPQPDTVLPSAQAIADGVRNQLIVLSFAELPQEERELGIQRKR